MYHCPPYGHNTGGVNVLKELKAAQPVAGVRINVLIDDITILLPPELAVDMEAIAKIVGWVQAQPLKEGLALNRSNLEVLFPGGVDAEDISADQRAELERTELTKAGRGMKMVEVSIRIDENQKDFATEVAMGEGTELLRM